MKSLILRDGAYDEIMCPIQKIEELAWEGVFPDKAPEDQTYRKIFQDILSETRNLQRIIQENLLITPNAAGPDGPEAA